MVTSMLLCLHWDQACALAGRGPQPARFALRPKRPGLLSRRYVAGILAAVGAFVVLPIRDSTRVPPMPIAPSRLCRSRRTVRGHYTL